MQSERLMNGAGAKSLLVARIKKIEYIWVCVMSVVIIYTRL